MAGSEVFSSMMASSRRRRAESKILPQIANLVADRGVGVFEIAKHRSLVYGNLARRLNPRAIAVIKAQA
jgi:hypothetical protein